MKDLSNELKFKFLGIDISRIQNGLVLSQKHLINKILKTFNMVVLAYTTKIKCN